MKNKFLLAIPVGIAAVTLGCEPKNDLSLVKGSVDSLKTQWVLTDSVLSGNSLRTKSQIELFQQNYLAITSNEALASINDTAIKAEIDSFVVVADMEVKEAEAANIEFEGLLAEWKSETEELNQLIAKIEANDVPADSAEMEVTEFKNYLVMANMKSTKIQEVIEDTKKQHEIIASEINKKVNPATTNL